MSYGALNPHNSAEPHVREVRRRIETTYAPDRPEKVYCEQCYLKEVY